MRAARIAEFGLPDVISIVDIARPQPGENEILVRVNAAGVGPWDALVRQGFSALPQPLPLTLGSDLSGVVDAVGPGVSAYAPGDEVYGVTNAQFTGAYAEYAVASTGMVAKKPSSLTFTEAASVPVVAATASEMLFDHAHLEKGQSVLIHGAAGNVGAFAVQLAKNAGLRVIATASAKDGAHVRDLGADEMIDYRAAKFEEVVAPVDAVIDTVGGDTRQRSYVVLKPGGILVTAAAPIPDDEVIPDEVTAMFFMVEVSRERLEDIAGMFDRGILRTRVGTVLSLDDARTAHELLAGAPHDRGKIVLKIAPSST
ncbi:MAG: NADP-dependent oxidoreductase [Gammaproteobacteria bacterium]